MIAGGKQIDGHYRLVRKVQVSDSTYKLVFAAPDISLIASPGQFVMVETRVGFLRRPISIARACDGEITLLVREFGAGSRDICQSEEGTYIGLFGPLGRGFPVENGNVAMIGGGIGVAPLIFANEHMRNVKLFIYGEGRGISVVDKSELPKDARIFTEDGSIGTKGNVCTGLDLSGIDVVFSCGPEPMLRAVVAMCVKAEVRVYVSLEERMACGFGACVGCVVSTVDGYKKVCSEGPVFDGTILYHDMRGD